MTKELIQSKTAQKLRQLLSDFGYKFAKPYLIRKKFGFMPEVILRSNCRDIFDAVEMLIPLEDEIFFKYYSKITKEND